jgi:hypothetical protein
MSPARALVAWSVLAACPWGAAAAGCGGKTGSNAATGNDGGSHDSGVKGGSSSGSSSSGSSSGSGSSSSGGGGDAGGVLPSVILFAQCGDPSTCQNGSPYFLFEAAFDSAAVPPVGACALSSGLGGFNATSDNAGNVLLSGASITPGTSIEYEPYGYQIGTVQTWFTTGQTVTASATGGTVPAFAQSVTAGPFVPITTPSMSGGAVTIPTSADLAVTWSGGQGGATMLLELIGQAGAGQLAVTCQWDATLGHGAVPHALLQQFQAQATYPGLMIGQMTTNTFTLDYGYSVAESAMLYSDAKVTFE